MDVNNLLGSLRRRLLLRSRTRYARLSIRQKQTVMRMSRDRCMNIHAPETRRDETRLGTTNATCCFNGWDSVFSRSTGMWTTCPGSLRRRRRIYLAKPVSAVRFASGRPGSYATVAPMNAEHLHPRTHLPLPENNRLWHLSLSVADPDPKLCA